jgi:hypothetical protein
MDIPRITVKEPLTVTLSESQLEEVVNAHIVKILARHLINVHVTSVKWVISHDNITEYSYFDGAIIELQSK